MSKPAKDLTPKEWREELNNRANIILNELMAARELAQSLGKDSMLIQPPYLDALLRLVEEFAGLVKPQNLDRLARESGTTKAEVMVRAIKLYEKTLEEASKGNVIKFMPESKVQPTRRQVMQLSDELRVPFSGWQIILIREALARWGNQPLSR